jgi:hypothetical protein
VHPFQIESQPNETPFTSRRSQATQGELSKAENFFDDANNPIDSKVGFAVRI